MTEAKETNPLMQSSAVALRPPSPAAAPPLQARRGRPVTIRLPVAAPCPPAEIGSALAEALESRWQLYRERLCRCQEEFSEKAVHELRVATRRLLAEVALLTGVAPSGALEKARRMLKRRLRALGDLRDTQVLRQFIEQRIARFPELSSLRSRLKRRARRLAPLAAQAVGRCKTRKLEKLIAAVRKSLTANAGQPRAQSRLASSVLRTVAQAYAEAVERRQAIDLAELRTVHQTRVAFKRFRYMLESLSPQITGLSRRQLRALAYYQRKMGIIQDLEVMRECVARHVRGNKGREVMLQRFSRHLRQRRARALRSFLKSADRLYAFWPPAKLAAPRESTSTRNAA